MVGAMGKLRWLPGPSLFPGIAHFSVFAFLYQLWCNEDDSDYELTLVGSLVTGCSGNVIRGRQLRNPIGRDLTEGS